MLTCSFISTHIQTSGFGEVEQYDTVFLVSSRGFWIKAEGQYSKMDLSTLICPIAEIHWQSDQLVVDLSFMHACEVELVFILSQ